MVRPVRFWTGLDRDREICQRRTRRRSGTGLTHGKFALSAGTLSNSIKLTISRGSLDPKSQLLLESGMGIGLEFATIAKSESVMNPEQDRRAVFASLTYPSGCLVRR